MPVKCTACGRENDRQGKLCSKCIEYYKADRERKRNDLTLCTRCGVKNDSEDGSRSCSKCSKYYADRWQSKKDNPEFKIMKAASDKKWAESNSDYIKKKHHDYYLAHMDEIKKRAHDWAKDNREHVNDLHEIKHREQRKDPTYRLKENTERRDWARHNMPRLRVELIARFGSKCEFCGYDQHPEILHFDHRVPILRVMNHIRGGGWGELSEIKENPEKYQLLCPRCNKYKLYTSDIQYYLSKKDKITKENFVPHSRWQTYEQYEHHKEQGRINGQKRRLKVIELFGGKCAMCGYCEHWQVLEFDHKIPIFRITNGIGRSPDPSKLKKIVREKEKYQLLCANCHEVKRIKDDLRLFRENSVKS